MLTDRSVSVQKSFRRRESFLIYLISFVIGGLSFVMAPNSYADSLKALQRALPGQVKAWKAEPGDRFFDDKTIFDYIDGAGEVYRAYNMRGCLSRRYSAPNGPPIILDIFDMGTSEDAFGVFTHDQEGEPIDVGQGALYRPGWLRLWKGRYFVSVYAEEETAAAEKAVRELGRMVASLIKTQGPKPQILFRLPPEGLQPKSVRYFHDHNILNYHYYVSDGNILNLGPKTRGALATYRRGKEKALLVLVQYPDPTEATKALASLLSHYLPESDSTSPIMLENQKWSVAAAKGRLVAMVLESASRQLAASLLREVIESPNRPAQ